MGGRSLHAAFVLQPGLYLEVSKIIEYNIGGHPSTLLFNDKQIIYCVSVTSGKHIIVSGF